MKTKRLIMALSLGLGLTLGLVWLLVGGYTVSHATGFTVDVTSDKNDGCAPGHCSLREAISAANSNNQADTITLGAFTYTLTISGINEEYNATGDLDIITDTHALTITGLGPGQTIINANGIDRVFDIHIGTVVISGVTVMNGFGDLDGGGIYSQEGSLTLINVRVISNTINDDGGGLYIENGQVTLIKTNILSNTSHNGGGVHVEYGQVTAVGGEIGNNTADLGGGGMYLQESSSSAILSGTRVISNGSSLSGGGMYIWQGNVTLTDTHLLSNTTASGGGVYVMYGQVTAENGEISYNRVTQHGGGVFIEEGDGRAILRGTRLIGNNTVEKGGGIYINNGHATVSAGQILSNTAGYLGGGGGIGNGVLTITDNSLVAYNRVTGSLSGYGGGGLSLDSSSALLKVIGGQISSNTAKYGGGVYVDGGQVTVTSGEIHHNTADEMGGAVLVDDGQITFEGGEIHNNAAGEDGGGMAIHQSGSSAILSGTRIISNSTPGGSGGGLYVRACFLKKLKGSSRMTSETVEH